MIRGGKMSGSPKNDLGYANDSKSLPFLAKDIYVFVFVDGEGVLE